MNKFNKMLNKYKDSKVTCLMNKGNRGDGIIHEGGRRLFKANGIDFDEIVYPAEASGDTLFVYGCGAFCEKYHSMIERTNYYIDKFKEVYILPTSFEVAYKPVKDFLSNLPKKVHIYCREKYSYRQALKYKKEISLNKDLAFYFDYTSWKKKGGGKLISFRTDEQLPKFISKDLNNDVSLGGRHDNWREFIEEISGYEEVHTNRAHVAIVSAMLEKKTFVYSGAYHKLKGIYEYSLSKLNNVRWIAQKLQ